MRGAKKQQGKGARLAFPSQAETIGTNHHSDWRIELLNELCCPSERALGKLIRFVACDKGEALVVVTKLDGEGIQAGEKEPNA